MSNFKFIGRINGNHRKNNITYGWSGDLIPFDIKNVVGSDDNGRHLKLFFIKDDEEFEYWVTDVVQISKETPTMIPTAFIGEKGVLCKLWNNDNKDYICYDYVFSYSNGGDLAHNAYHTRNTYFDNALAINVIIPQ